VHCITICGALGADSSTRYSLSTNEVLAGTWTLSITYRGFAGPKLTSWQVAVDLAKPPTGCYGTNSSDYKTGNFVMDSPLGIACNGHAAANTTVEVHLTQPNLYEFRVYLVAANGDAFLLQPAVDEYQGTSMNEVYTVNASAEPAYEVWRLRVAPSTYSFGPFPAGLLDSWTLDVAPIGPSTAVTASNNNRLEVWDSGTLGSTIAVSGVAGDASNHSTARVRVTPTQKINYLTFYLVSPDGTRYLLGQTTYHHTAAIDVTYPVNPSLELRNGTWRLDIVPSGLSEGWGVAFLDTWTLTV
jgi:subtilisin-like proprotein convertase family protein